MADMIITCDDGSTYVWHRDMAQGPAHIATSEEIALDDHGLTNPNLHRRIDPQPPTDPTELKPRDYMLAVHGYNSYRTITQYLHDEESTTDETP